MVRSVRGLIKTPNGIRNELGIVLESANHYYTSPNSCAIDPKILINTQNQIREEDEKMGIKNDETITPLNTGSKQFEDITKEMLDTFIKKNADYGSSFDKSLDENGLIASKVRMEDKMNRFGNLIKHPQKVADESLEDTLLDMANYAIMTVMWMRGQDKQLEMDLRQTFSKAIEVGSMVMINSADGPYKVEVRVESVENDWCKLEGRYGYWPMNQLSLDMKGDGNE